MAEYKRSAILMSAEKIIKMFSQLTILILVAKFYGPDGLGLLTFCFAFVSVFLFLVNYGFESLSVKIFREDQSNVASAVLNLLTIRCFFAICSIFIILMIANIMFPGDRFHMILVISLYLIFIPSTTYEWFFQSQGDSRIAAYGYILSHILGLVCRLLLIYFSADLIYLAWVYLVEVLVFSIFFRISYSKSYEIKDAKLNRTFMWSKVVNATPLMISSGLVLIYMRMDQIMLGYFGNDELVGIYSAGARLAEALIFLITTIVSVYFPKFIDIYNSDSYEDFESFLIKKSNPIFLILVFMCILTMSLSTHIVNVLYGEKFQETVLVLNIVIWCVPIVFLGSISSRVLIMKSEYKGIFYRSLGGVCVALAAGVLLIPSYGVVGAAVTLLLSQIVSSILINALQKDMSVIKLQIKIITFNPIRYL